MKPTGYYESQFPIRSLLDDDILAKGLSTADSITGTRTFYDTGTASTGAVGVGLIIRADTTTNTNGTGGSLSSLSPLLSAAILPTLDDISGPTGNIYVTDQSALRYQNIAEPEEDITLSDLPILHNVTPDKSGLSADEYAVIEAIIDHINATPTAMRVVPVTAFVDEGDNLAARKLADAVFIDDAFGENKVRIADNEIFEIRNDTELWLKDGASLDFEAGENHNVTLIPVVTGSGTPPKAQTFTLRVRDVALRIDNIDIITAGYTDIVQADSEVGNIIGQVTASGPGKLTYRLSNRNDAPSAYFRIDDESGQIFLKEKLDVTESSIYELKVTVTAEGEAELTQSKNFAINVAAANRREATVYEGRTLSVTEIHADADGDSFSYKPVVRAHRTAYGIYKVVNGRTLIWTPDAGFTGRDIFNVSIRDSRGGETIQTLAITVLSALAITGPLEAREDSPWLNPTGDIVIVDPERNADDYILSIGTTNEAGVTTSTQITADNTDVVLQYGILTVNRNGSWFYTLDNSNAAVEALDGDNDDTDGAVSRLTETVTVTYRPNGNLDAAANAYATGIPTGIPTETGGLTTIFNININGLTDYYLAEIQDGSLLFSLEEHLSVHADGSLEGNYLFGGAGNDVLAGTDSIDWLLGNDGNDVLFGGESDDGLIGGRGNDVLHGGPGNDLVYISFYGYPATRIIINAGDTQRWKWNNDGTWTPGSGDGYIFQRFYIDLNNNNVEDAGDEYDFFTDIERFWINGSAHNDVLTGGIFDDSLNGYSGNDIIDGGAGNDVLFLNLSDNDNSGTVIVDAGGTIGWKQNADGVWVSGSGEGYIYYRFYADLNNNNVEDAADEYDFFTDIERLEITGSGKDDILIGGKGPDDLSGKAGDDILRGGAGEDRLYGGNDDDTLSGGKGQDTIYGGSGNDIFVLYQGSHAVGETNIDIVHDFTFNTDSGGEKDRISVQTGGGNVTNLIDLQAAAHIYWTNDGNHSGNADTDDTIFYATNGTEDSDDDIILMVLTDFTEELTMEHFEVV